MEPTKARVEDRTLEIERSFARIEMDNLTREVSEGNSEATWWGILAAKAHGAHRRAETRIDVVKAEAEKRIRALANSNDKKITNPEVEALVTLSPEVQAAITAEIDAEENAAIVKAAHDGAAGKARTLEKMSTLLGQELFATRTPDLPAPRKRKAPEGQTEAPARVTKQPVA